MSEEPKVAQKKPYVVELKAGETYYWCACGHSKNQPFCDASHKGKGITPIAFVSPKTEAAYLCGCKASKKKPFCDGTHKSL
ncbi:MAG: CDGSH iron-sulfur domain-containing protein [Nitrospinota bacterium]|nr:CDGSH iron-sulfur domain-containing protein [Nitrospinota bacterium]